MFVKLDCSVLESKALSHCDKLVYCAIRSFDGFAVVNPSESQLSKRCGVSIRQVGVSLKSLERLGIRREGRVFKIPDEATIAEKSAATACKSAATAIAATAEIPAATPRSRQPLPLFPAATADSTDRTDIYTEDIKPYAPRNGAGHRRNGNGNGHKPDPRHSEFKNYYFAMYQIKFAGVPAVPWDLVDGAQLNLLLKKNPSFDIPTLKQLFMNWWESDNTNRALKPAKWLPRLPEYASGPQDVYGRPMKELRLL